MPFLALRRIAATASHRDWFRTPILLCLATACGSGTGPVDKPEIDAPTQQLSLVFDAPISAPLQVVSVSPEGAQQDTNVQINVVFNKPIRSVVLAENEQPPPISITPAMAGKWSWVGTGAVSFVPEPNAVHEATRYTVHVPQGVTALDGTRLDTPRSFEFETPRPAVVNLSPEKDESPLQPRSRWVVDFNLPVTPKALTPLLHVSAQPDAGGKIEIEVEIQRHEETPERLVLIPKRPLPLESKIDITVDAGLATSKGPLLSDQPYSADFRTYGKLNVQFVCDAGETQCNAPPHVVFSNPVTATSASSRISVTSLSAFSAVATETTTADFLLKGRYERRGRYRVVVAAGVTDVYGQKLPERFEHDFEMGEGHPQLEIGAAAGFLEPELGSTVNVASINVPDYDLTWSRLTPEQVQRYLEAGRSALDPGAFRREHVTSMLGLNRQHTHVMSLPALLGDPGANRRGGAVALNVRSASLGGAYEDQLRVIHPTDLAVTAIRSSVGGRAWVTRLSDGRPVPNAKLRVLGLSHGFGAGLVTDEHGLAELSAFGTETDIQGRAPILIAETDGDWAYARIDAARQYEPRTLVSLSTERDLYRPGEQVHVKGWLRHEQAVGTAALTARDVKVKLQDGERVLREIATKTNAFGGFDAVLEVPNGASVGRHAIVALSEGESTSASIKVGEYRPTEFSAEVQVNRKEALPREAISARLSGSYLFGAPMSGMTVSYFGEPSATSVQPPGTEGYDTDAWSQQGALSDALALGQLRTMNSVETVLDGDGQAQAELKPRFDLLGPVQFTFMATVQDATRQAVSAGDVTLIHPGEFYLALQVPDVSYAPKQKIAPKVLVVKPSGERVSGQRVRVELYRQPWDHRWADNVKVQRIGHCDLVSANDPVSCQLQVTEGGAYFALARAKDSRNDPIYAASNFYVDGWSYGPASEDLKVTLDKEQYRVGSTARVTVSTPIPDAEVLLTLEQSRVLWSGSQRARGRVAHFEVPVTENLGANVDVVAYVARPSKLSKANLGETSRPWDAGPALVTERAQLLVDQSWRHLQVKVIPERTTTTPGAKVKVRFEVVDGLGKPRAAELAVAAVDEGVLSLTAHQVQDPFGAFTGARENVVSFVDSRAELGWLYRPQLDPNEAWGVGQGFGSGHGRLGGSHRTRGPVVRMGKATLGPGADPRADFRTTPYWNPSVLTDAQGRAEVDVNLSQLLTRFRVSAIAVAKDDFFGAGHSAIETQKPLMARPALPRFLRVGDRFDAGIIVSSVALTSPGVRVSVTAAGVELVGPNEHTQPIAAGQSKEVRFSFAATAPGTARFDFRIDAGDAKDRVLVELPVELSVTPQAVALYGKTDGAQAEVIGSLKGASATYGGLQVSTASTALVGLGEGINQLIEYPYGCTEQLSSRLLPLLPLRELAKDFGVQLPDDLDEEIQTTVDKIVARQRHDGGFGLWDKDPESHPWLTAYVYRTLQHASTRAVRVPEATLSSALRFLQAYIEQEQDEFYRPTLALIAHVLAESGNAPQNAIGRLMIDDPQDALFVRALTLETLVLAKRVIGKVEEPWRKDVDSRIKQLSKQIESKIRLSSNRAFVEADSEIYGWLFDSTTRTNAMVLSALLTYNPQHPLAERLARGLLEVRRGGTWRSTQETGYALLALESYRKKQEAAVPNFEAVVSFGKQELGRTKHQGRSFEREGIFLPMSALPRQGSRLTFEKRGDGTLFYQALLRYSLEVPPSTPLDHGFVVAQGLHAVARGELPVAVEQGLAPSETRFAAGSVVLGQITVTTPTARDFVVVEAPLPAGLEAIDTELSINAAEGLADDAGEGRPGPYLRSGWGRAWSRRELRDDRVLFFINRMPPGVYRYRYFARATSAGQFVLPPISAQEMYAPENFGRTGAQRVEVH